MFSAEDVITAEILNILPEHLCIINLQGKILFVNKSCIDFEYNNSDKVLTNCLNVNYLDVCDQSAKFGCKLAKKTAQGIKVVANKKQVIVKIEYLCKGPEENR